MEVFKRPNSPNWYVDLVHPARGKRLRQSLKCSGSRKEAQDKAARLQFALEQAATEAQTGPQSITLRECLGRYIEALKAKGKVAAEGHAYRRDRLLGLTAKSVGRFCLDGDMSTHELTPALMEALALARAREGKKPQTIKHELSLIRSAVRYVAELDFRVPERMTDGRAKNPWRVPKVATKTRYLSPEEYRLVLAYLDPERPVTMNARGGRVVAYQLPSHQRAARAEARHLLIALAYTGGRWSEVATMTWDRVQLPGVLADGSRMAGIIHLWAGKVQKERVVPMATPLADVLRRRLAERDGGESGNRLVFPGPDGRPRTKPSEAIGDAMTACGLNNPDAVAKYGSATVHSLRHTFASWLIQRGADLGEVADALGHASLTMTRRYAHLKKGATLAKLGGILDGV